MSTPNPFLGLVPYKAPQRLFERDGDVEVVVARLWAGPVTVLFAGSGVGKSSFLYAKLKPSFEEMFGANTVVLHNTWSDETPEITLRKLHDKFRSNPAASQETHILILDQFEEIFQYFPNQVLLAAIGAELAAFVADPDLSSGFTAEQTLTPVRLDIRLLICIREDFLAALAGFDEYLPRIFNNYYRLENLTAPQARSIIEQTAASVNVGTGSGMNQLLQDLVVGTNIPNTRHVPIGRDDSHPTRDGQPSHADQPDAFIDAPFLQIACKGLWLGEEPSPDKPFLGKYTPGQAQNELDAYCRRALDKFGWRQRNAVSAAIPELTGERQAKKAVSLKQLQQTLPRARKKRLREVLDGLSSIEFRILRHSKDRDEDDVYQLYHDMYSPLLWRWRGEHEQKRRTLFILTTCLSIFLFTWVIVQPLIALIAIRNALSRPLGTPNEITNVVNARDHFTESVLLAGVGNHIWREYNERLAGQKALVGDMDGALLHKFAAYGMDGTVSQVKGDELLPPSTSYLLGTIPTSPAPGLNNGFADVAITDESSYKMVAITTQGNLTYFSPMPGIAAAQVVAKRLKTPWGSALHEGARPRGAFWENSDGIKILCLSPNGDRAVVADLANLPDDFPPPGEREVHFGIVGLSKSNENPKIETALSMFSLDLPDTPGVIDDGVSAEFDEAGNRVAVIADGRISIWDGRKDDPIRCTQCREHGPVVQIAFSKQKPDEVAITYALGNDPLERRLQLERLRIQGRELIRTSTLAAPMQIPRSSRIVFRRNDDALLAYGSFLPGISSPTRPWHWYKEPREVGTEFVLPVDALPQSESEEGILLSESGDSSRLIFSRGEEQHPEFIEVAVGAPTRQPFSRVLTAASLARFSKSISFATFDPVDGNFRYWRVPPDAKWVSAEVLRRSPGPRSQDSEACRFKPYSVNPHWNATLDGASVTINQATGGKGARKWSDRFPVPLATCPTALLVSSKGTRVVAWDSQHVEYISQANQRLFVQQPDGLKEIVFGPGEDQITMRTDDELLVYRAMKSTLVLAWSSSYSGLQLLHDEDESGVVAVSQNAVHRLSPVEGRGAWRWIVEHAHFLVEGDTHPIQVNSVFVDVPLEPGMLKSKSYGSQVLSIIDAKGNATPTEIDFKREDNRWLAMRQNTSKTFGRGDRQDCSNQLKGVPNDPSPFCRWEAITGKKLVSGPIRQ
jgi:hypothetical protein